MKSYRKKPVIVQAIQYRDIMRVEDCLPEGVHIAPTPLGDMPVIQTLEGTMIVYDGDYVITGIKGERYPCKPDIFEATYEPVEENTNESETRS